jgi:hypothetical protein
MPCIASASSPTRSAAHGPPTSETIVAIVFYAVSPLYWPAPRGLTFDAVVAAFESAEFLRQSRAIADAWGKAGGRVDLPGHHRIKGLRGAPPSGQHRLLDQRPLRRPVAGGALAVIGAHMAVDQIGQRRCATPIRHVNHVDAKACWALMPRTRADKFRSASSAAKLSSFQPDASQRPEKPDTYWSAPQRTE